MTKQAAIILGASGSVGQALLAEIIQCGQFHPVIVLARRPLRLDAAAGVEQRLVPEMTPAHLTEAVMAALQACDAGAVGFSVLGVGANTASLTLAEHRAIDVDLNAAFAKGLKDSGKVTHLAFMSAIGADIQAKSTGSGAAGMPRYARVKGEAEAAVQASGLALVSIFRPSLIVGSQHTPAVLARLFGWLAPLIPANYRAIRTTEIAQAMVAVALRTPDSSAIYCFPQMQQLLAAEPAAS